MHILIKRLLIFVSKASPSSHPTASLLPSLPGSEPHLLLSLEFSFSHAKHCSSVSTPLNLHTHTHYSREQRNLSIGGDGVGRSNIIFFPILPVFALWCNNSLSKEKKSDR